MATANYMVGRKRYQRPQAMLWSDNPGTLTSSGLYVPVGTEIGSVADSAGPADSFIVLSDHGRKEISMSPERIEKRERMINGRMRSYHIADKLKIDISWDMLPSRSYSENPEFLLETIPAVPQTENQNYVPAKPAGTSLFKGSSLEYTADGGAGGVALLDWYDSHQGPFWVFLAYDKYSNFPSDGENSEYGHLAQYNQIVEVYFSKFDYSIVKRGGSNYDMWNISVSLEEV